MIKKTVFGLAFAVAVIAAGCVAGCVMVSDVDLTVPALAQDFRFTVKDGEVTITGYKGSATDIAIPRTINGLPVTAIGDMAFGMFGSATKLTSVIIPDGVTAIGQLAFAENQLTSVVIGNAVTTIGQMAFWGNQLTSVIIPDGVTVIENMAFSGNQLTSVTIGNAVAVIGYWAFSGNQLADVTIPPSVTTIGEAAFYENPLDSVALPGNVDIDVTSFNGLLYVHYTGGDRQAADYVFSHGSNGEFDWMESDGAVEITGYQGTEKELAIPAEIDGLPVVAIGPQVFYHKELTGVTLPDGVAAIGIGAFLRNQLTSVSIPDGVTAIGMAAFTGNQLTSVSIPDGVTDIGREAFARNQLSSVTLPDSLTTIEVGAFNENELSSVIIPDSVAFIGDYAFEYNPVVSVTIGAGVDITVRMDGTFHGDLALVYVNGGKAAGTYIRSNADSTAWTKEQ